MYLSLKNRKDTVEHVFNAVDRTFGLVELPELFAEVEESMKMTRQRNILPRGFWQEAHPEVKLSVRAERERSTTVIWVHGLRTQEPFELQPNHAKTV